jgi:hypothetical protein
LNRTEPTSIAVVGAARTGKTYQAKRALAAILAERGQGAPVVIFDPSADWCPAGAEIVRTRKEYLAALVKRLRFLVVRGVFENWRPLEELRGRVVVVDEAHNFASGRSIHASFRRIICEGPGHRDMDVIVSTQRARHLNPAVLANVQRAILLPVRHPSDREVVEDALGIVLPEPNAWRTVILADGSEHPRARAPYLWPEDFGDDGRLKNRTMEPERTANPRGS